MSPPDAGSAWFSSSRDKGAWLPSSTVLIVAVCADSLRGFDVDSLDGKAKAMVRLTTTPKRRGRGVGMQVLWTSFVRNRMRYQRKIVGLGKWKKQENYLTYSTLPSSSHLSTRPHPRTTDPRIGIVRIVSEVFHGPALLLNSVSSGGNSMSGYTKNDKVAFV